MITIQYSDIFLIPYFKTFFSGKLFAKIAYCLSVKSINQIEKQKQKQDLN